MEKSLTPRLRIVDLVIHQVGPIRLDVMAGECVGISGASGSGKSLFLRAIADMEPHEGMVLLDGTAQDGIAAPRWRKQVALLPAESAWWFDTVGDHFTDSDASGLAQMELAPQILAWPVARLSSGERQRLALLRMLENRPRMLLLDEPTANLDEANTVRIETLIHSYCKATGAAVLWVGHQHAQLRRMAGRIFHLTGGSLVAASGDR